MGYVMSLIEIDNLSVTYNANGRKVRAVAEVKGLEKEDVLNPH